MVNYVNTASTATLSGSISAVDTTCAVTSYSGFPSASFWAIIARGTPSAEIVQVTNVAGSTLTISRGQDGTSASSHGAGDTFEHVVPATHFTTADNHVSATSTVHGVTGALVGTTDAQTLSNKTYRGAHTSVYSDVTPAGVTSSFLSTADTAGARDGFVHKNTGADAARAGFQLEQSGTPRFQVLNTGKVYLNPSATPGFENDGTTQLDGTTTMNAAATINSTLNVTGVSTLASASVTGNATVGGTLGVTGTTTLGTTNTGAISATTVTGSGAVNGATMASTGVITAYGGRVIISIASTASVTSPATGQVVFQTSDEKYYKYNGSAWVLLIPVPTVTVFTASGTWTKPSGCTQVFVRVVGGGGAGGGAAAASGGNGATGGGGGGGGYAEKLFAASTLASTETVTIGSGGTAATAGANAGGTANISSFATGKGYVVSGNGGVGGTGGTSSGSYTTTAGGAGGTASGGDVNISGQAGFAGFLAGGNPAPYNRGGASILGFGPAAPLTDGTGTTGQLYGSGSSGASNYAGAGAAKASTAGANGIVVVNEYYF